MYYYRVSLVVSSLFDSYPHENVSEEKLNLAIPADDRVDA
jgi:hypothetical protein